MVIANAGIRAIFPPAVQTVATAIFVGFTKLTEYSKLRTVLSTNNPQLLDEWLGDTNGATLWQSAAHGVNAQLKWKHENGQLYQASPLALAILYHDQSPGHSTYSIVKVRCK